MCDIVKIAFTAGTDDGRWRLSGSVAEFGGAQGWPQPWCKQGDLATVPLLLFNVW